MGFLQEIAKVILKQEIDNLNTKINNQANEIFNLQLQISELKQSPNPKEDYFNNKYPKSDIKYLRHETDGDYQVDVRDFYTINDSSIPIVTGKDDDEKALNGLKWVINNITYTPDASSLTYKDSEYWAYAYQTLKHKKGDCEDGAILLANILQKSGIPYWKIRLNAGATINGGHAYVVYYCETSDKWVILDWCYWPNVSPISQRADYKAETNYQTVWFSWNSKYCFSKGLNDANDLLNKKEASQAFSFKGWSILEFLKGRKKLLITLIGAIGGYIITNNPTFAVITAAVLELIYALFDYYIKE
jgi:predicted transglutaminase-like cysteine proteinase